MDIEAAAASKPAPTEGAPPAVPQAAPSDRHAAMRRGIAAAMSRSKREIPHYYLATAMDVERATAWLAEQNAARQPADRLLFAALLIKAVAIAIDTVPEMNGFWEGDAFRASEAVHIGVGISLRGGGLIAPALHDARPKTVDEVMAALRDVVGRARALNLRSSEITEGTITVSALGDDDGIDALFGVIYPPQVALVGFGSVARRPVVDEAGGLTARLTLTATLAADHRASDGRRGALFLKTIARLLQEPGRL
jgi:pyruvate dehydrogenase E2 component (dihydrolipoamide acetyltransferase)